MSVPLLLSPKQVRLNKPGVMIIDARSFKDYHRGHIPGAVNFPLAEYHWADTSPEGIKAFTNHMERLLGFVGVSRNSHVIFYEDTSGMMAARGVWLLHYLGHDKASILDGGLRAWKKIGYKTTTHPTPPKPTTFTAYVHPEVLATINRVSNSLKDPNISLLDVRSGEEYNGTLVRAARGGHIPKAKNVDWKRTLTRQGTLKPIVDLKRLYDREGLAMNGEIITYCQAGYRAAHSYVILKLLGYSKVRNYLGSWFEWANAPGTPVENRNPKLDTVSQP